MKNVILNMHNKKYKANNTHKFINNFIEIPDEIYIKEMCCETYDADLLSISLDKNFNPTFHYAIFDNQSYEMYELKITLSNNQWSVKSYERKTKK